MQEYCLLNHVYINSFRGIIEATGKFPGGGGHLITWNGPVMGHLNSFSASGVGNLNKIQMPGGLPGGGCLSFDLTVTLGRAADN